MSRGPGRIERAIRALFDAHPDLAFVTDELIEHCYPEAQRVSDRPPRLVLTSRHPHEAERLADPNGVPEFPPKYQVAVLRAAKKVIARDPDWSMHRSESWGGTWTFFNRANAQSWAMASEISEWHVTYRSPKRIRRHDRANPRWDRWPKSHVIKDHDAVLTLLHSPHSSTLARYAKHAAQHIAYRDGDAEARARLDAEKAAAKAAWLKGPSPDKCLEAAPGAASQHIDLPAIAAQARRLITENDPDAIRAGLAQIADALDAITAAPTEVR